MGRCSVEPTADDPQELESLQSRTLIKVACTSHFNTNRPTRLKVQLIGISFASFELLLGCRSHHNRLELLGQDIQMATVTTKNDLDTTSMIFLPTTLVLVPVGANGGLEVMGDI
jgi:hypothetical protein